MKTVSRVTLILAAFALMLAGNAVSEDRVKQIPLELFFKELANHSFQISPDGDQYAYLAQRNGRQLLTVSDIADGEVSTLDDVAEGEIESFFWYAPNILILHLNDREGNSSLHSIHAKSMKARRLGSGSDVEFRLGERFGTAGGEIVIEARRKTEKGWRLQRLNPATNATTPLLENLENVVARLFDHNGIYRMAIREQGTKSEVLFRDRETEPFHHLFDFDNARDFFRPQCFDSENKKIMAYSNLRRDKVALVEYDPRANGEVKVLWEDPEYDLFGDDESDFVKCSAQKNRLGYIFYTTQRRTYHFFDESYQQLISGLQGRFPDYEILVVSSDASEKKHIIKISSDRLAGRYYFFNNVDNSLRLLGEECPWLEEGKLARKTPICYKSRDGFPLHGYLTTPPGVKPESLPLVVYPHGGPQWRDCWEMGRFTEIQFLASRGYAVLQVNFRGSTGYGKAFMTAGFKQNGMNVQNDISDGVHYLVGRHIVDRHRVAILGGSYGGYTVLAGLAFSPEIYACGVDLFGVSNFFTFLQALPPWFNKESLYQTIGHPELDRDLLERTSPVFHAERIRAPLFIAQGGKDPIVNRAESDQMVAALSKRGVPVEYFMKENEGHGYFRDEQSRLELWYAIESFLSKYLKQPWTGHGQVEMPGKNSIRQTAPFSGTLPEPIFLRPDHQSR